MSRTAVQSKQSIDLPPLCFRADVQSIDAEARTVELVFSTGAPVERMDWWTGKRYIEKLSLKPEHIKLDRFNAGAPLLDAHSAWSIVDQIGVVEAETARVTAKEARVTVRFSRRAAVEPIWNDVQDGIYRSVSVGYRIYRFEEETPKDGAIPTRTATLWEPYEVSLVPMPADIGAKVRSDKNLTYACEIVPVGTPIQTRSDAAPVKTEQVTATKEQQMSEERSETIAEINPLVPDAPTTRTEPPPAPEPTDVELARAAETGRVTGIMQACRAARMTTEFMDGLIRESVPLVDAQTRIFAEMRKRGGDDVAPRQTGTRTDVSLGPDPMVHVRAGIENALLHRIAPEFFKLEDVGRNYRGLRILDIARVFLQGRGIRVTQMSPKELASAALGLSTRATGMHTTSDFALLLADVANKSLRRAYEEQPQTFRPLVTVRSLPDFKPVKRLQLGDAPALLEIEEHGEYTSGTISEGKEQYQLATYGRKFAITRKALINDDTDAFSRIPMLFGRKSRVLESNLVWAQITGNPTMGDNNALFSAAHGNLQTDGDHISVASLGRARAALRAQTSLDGDYLNLTAAYLLVPTGIETKADQFVTVITPQLSGNVNPFQGKLTVIADPRLDANSATAWYLAASPAQIDLIELAYLEGEEGPQVESRVGFDIDGLEIKCRLDVAAKVLDWRGFHKDPGDLDT